jgi:hypothetical protein
MELFNDESKELQDNQDTNAPPQEIKKMCIAMCMGMAIIQGWRVGANHPPEEIYMIQHVCVLLSHHGE